jgi:hypothetical protein
MASPKSRVLPFRKTTGLKGTSNNYFWPRLGQSAKPLGPEAEARKAQQIARAQDNTNPLDDVDTWVVFRGGPGMLQCKQRLTAEGEASPLNPATCIMLERSFQLYERAIASRDPGKPGKVPGLCLQGVLSSIDRNTGTVKLHFGAVVAAKGQTSYEIDTHLENPDIWWSVPYWVGADYEVHLEKLPVKSGFYFYGEAGLDFRIVTLNWSHQVICVKSRVDGKYCSQTE